MPRAAVSQIDAAADEADTGNDLGGDTRGIENNPAVAEDIHEAIFLDQHE